MNLGLALALGMLVGLQRERTGSRIAGLRTFGLVTLLGAVCAQLGPWAIGVALLAVTVLTVVGNVAKIRGGQVEPGMTTEVALILMCAVGALVVLVSPELGLAVGGGTAVLLHFKRQLHGFASKIGEKDFNSMIQFALLTMVILPILPDQAYGPYSVFNPREVWWMVVLIVGIGLGGYIGYKLLGRKGGVAVGGILGGLISSTATTVSYARRSREGTVPSSMAVAVVLLASAVVFVRVLFEIAVVGPSFLPYALPPLGVVLLLLAIFCLINFKRDSGSDEQMPTPGNPTELRSALIFGLLYAVVSLAVAFARDHMGEGGLYLVAVLSGLTDMDAITLSTARLVESKELVASTGWRVILVASIANLLFKGGTVALWGSPRLFRRLALWWGLTILGGGLVLLGWPS